jgi:Transposase IS116/IS110/IS902 family
LSRINFADLTTREGHPLTDRLRRELEREYARLDLVQQQLRTMEKERDMADNQEPAVDRKRKMLCAPYGVKEASAAILAREIFARSFVNRRQLGSYLGLTPSAYDSGSTTRCKESGQISKSLCDDPPLLVGVSGSMIGSKAEGCGGPPHPRADKGTCRRGIHR